MTFLPVLALAVGLSMDAMAAAAVRGLGAPVLRTRDTVTVALLFGGFQAAMPLLGYGLGSRLGPWVAAWDHWVIFLLLGGIGAKMIHGSLQPPAEQEAEALEQTNEGRFGVKPLLVLAVATSLDAFAAGITLPMMQAPLWLSVATIGLTTAVLSVVGLSVGRRFGALLGRHLDAAGGVMLVLLGTKILVEHLRAA